MNNEDRLSYLAAHPHLIQSEKDFDEIVSWLEDSIASIAAQIGALNDHDNEWLHRAIKAKTFKELRLTSVHNSRIQFNKKRSADESRQQRFAQRTDHDHVYEAAFLKAALQILDRDLFKTVSREALRIQGSNRAPVFVYSYLQRTAENDGHEFRETMNNDS